MRTLHWLFLVSALLFISGIGFVIAAGRTVKAAAPAAATATAAAPPSVATVRQLMLGMIQPSADAVWNSVSTVVDAEGVHENQPRTDEEWAIVAANAAVLIESGNMLLAEDRAVDKDAWAKFSNALRDSSKTALAAAEKKDAPGILAVGEVIYASCTGCHEQYLRE